MHHFIEAKTNECMWHELAGRFDYRMNIAAETWANSLIFG